MNYIITGDTYNSKFIEDLAKREDIIAMTGQELLASDLYFNKEDKVYVPSETSLSIVMDRMQDQEYVQGINKLKNKYFCRQVIAPLYPDFYFAKASLADIPNLDLQGKKVIIKPLKGFFGTGVRQADSTTDLVKLAQEMEAEVKASAKFFPESILTQNEYIIEEYIEGQEFAVDMFFDQEGNPAIMNIYFHPQPAVSDYFHLMYYTNKGIFEDYSATFINFFKELNKIMQLKSFPIHAEFKLQAGVMVPIELNPMRYGGFGLSDLTYNSFKLQPITAYFDNVHPNWYAIWDIRKENNYAWILAYNGKDIDIEEFPPNHDKFLAYLEDNSQLIDYVKLDHKSNPVFALAYVYNQNLSKLTQLLDTEFNNFFD
jgi:hypothetical protein